MEVMIRGTWSGVITSWPLKGFTASKFLYHFVWNFDDPSRVIHYSKCGPFWSEIGSFSGKFGQDFRSKWGQIIVNLIWISLILSSILDKYFIDFHWFWMNLLSKIADFLSIFSKGVVHEFISKIADF